MDNLLDWLYSQIVGFLGNFFAEMGNMGVELFEMSWVQSVVLFFNQLGWALFGVSLVVACFECGIEYSSGRGNIQQTALNAIKGFMAVSLFSIVPVRLYALSVSLQGLMTTGLAGSGESIGSVGTRIIEELMTTDTLEAAMIGSRFGITAITSPIMLIFCIILMAYAVIKVFFANLKRGGIFVDSDSRRLVVYVQHSERLHRRVHAVDQAGDRPVSDGILTGDNPGGGAYGL